LGHLEKYVLTSKGEGGNCGKRRISREVIKKNKKIGIPGGGG